ncbi:ABC transporter ATP-binding protein [Moritella sp.]|uniref:ABC transporter ATP-binding protein n=1 Tax=Moritella sp. TaxID=78556 RepID=UPI001DFD60E1|nr:ABC transporter ATP-binding protein [Moritella sp.]MCJ8349615.1 ABC transporter ATP-binding protein [Moritella sp.]NQZ41187.1 ABC transporter ATP-binding protein [Moritella sp.]
MTTSSSLALRISDLHCSYAGVDILTGLDLDLGKNEILCLLGPSGCGKTTTLKLIAGLLPPTQGSIEINGHVVDNRDLNVAPEKRNVGMIFQDYALFPHLTVTDNVLFSQYKQNKAKQKETLDYVLKLVNLTEFADRYPHQLSGGQQQRVAIARALANSPELLLLDEPFSNIDSQVRHHLIEEMRSLLKSHNMSAIFVTHSKEEAFAFADRLAVFHQGKIEQLGTPSELYNRPATRFVADFLGKVNYLDAVVVDEYSVSTALGVISSKQKLIAAVGAHKLLAIRPQQLKLALSEQGSATITQQQFLGMTTHCTITVAEEPAIELSVSMQQPMAIGDVVSVTVDCHDLVLFDRD